MSRRPKNPTIDRLKGQAAVALMRMLALLPLRAAHALGGMIGLATYYLPNREAKTIRTNIALCYPQLSTEQRETLIRQSCIETGKTAAETPGIWLSSRERICSLVTEVENEAVLAKASDAGAGIIFCAPHMANWELTHLYMATRFAMTGLYKPGKLEAVDRLVADARAVFGSVALPTDTSGVRGVLKALKSGKTTFILPDHEPDAAGGEFAPFFGIPALTTTLSVKLAQRSGAPVVFLYTVRLPKGQGFRLVVRDPVDIAGASTIIDAVTMQNRETEACIVDHPEQYQWSYKRFKRRPQGMPRLY